MPTKTLGYVQYNYFNKAKRKHIDTVVLIFYMLLLSVASGALGSLLTV